jgi:hypothetical protein
MTIGGFIDDGCPALITSLRFGPDASPGSTFTIPTDDLDGRNFRAGDVVFFCQLAENTTSTPPAFVMPAGFTSLVASQVTTDGAGLGVRTATGFKIMTAADVGAVKTGMNGAQRNRLCGIALGFNRPVQSVSLVDSALTLSASAVVSRTVAWDGLNTGSHLYLGFAHGEVSISNAQYTWNAGPTGSAYDQNDPSPGTGGASPTRTYYTFTQQGRTPASSITMTLGPDMGDFNMNYAMLLRIT